MASLWDRLDHARKVHGSLLLGSPRVGNYGILTSIFQSAQLAAALSAVCRYGAGPAGAQMGEQLSTFNSGERSHLCG